MECVDSFKVLTASSSCARREPHGQSRSRRDGDWFAATDVKIAAKLVQAAALPCDTCNSGSGTRSQATVWRAWNVLFTYRVSGPAVSGRVL